MKQPASILFLCTGNYYRSRFAELLFNARARELGLRWRADSRGLALDRGIWNFGPIARSVVEALTGRGVELPPVRHPIQLTIYDLEEARRIIALKEAEHRPLLEDRYTGWADRVEYWHIHDNDVWTVEQTMKGIEVEIAKLLSELERGDGVRRDGLV
jgi:protein-tyrosine phosphatase